MKTNEDLKQLAQKFNLKYQYQEFEDCYSGNWFVITHSLYNESGCFTIHYIPQRMEVDFYIADRFTRNLRALCTQEVNVFEVEKEIWDSSKKIGPFKIPFYYCHPDRLVKTLIKVITAQIEKNNEFFGIKISSP